MLRISSLGGSRYHKGTQYIRTKRNWFCSWMSCAGSPQCAGVSARSMWWKLKGLFSMQESFLAHHCPSPPPCFAAMTEKSTGIECKGIFSFYGKKKKEKSTTTNAILKEYSGFTQAFPVWAIFSPCTVLLHACLLQPHLLLQNPWHDPSSLLATCYSRLPNGGSPAATMGQWRLTLQCCHGSGPIPAFYCTVVWQMYLTFVKRQKLQWEEGLWLAFSPMQFVPVELTLVLSSLSLFSFTTVQVKTFEPVRLLI